MRVIKFRAWDKQLNIMVYAGNEVIFYLNYLPQRIIMQFTGLLDKNGKEIYEGDILQTLNYRNKSEANYVFHQVKWSDKYNAYVVINLLCKTDELTESGNTFLYVLFNKMDSKIIGNIYATPEKLKS